MRNDSPSGPLDAEDLGQLLEVDGCALTNAENVVSEPTHAKVAELVVEELDAELRREERNVLNDGLSHAPLLVFGKVNDGRQKRLREQVNADNVVDELELAYQLEPDIALIVFEQLEEKREKVLDRRLLTEQRS